ncbi:HhoA/HhoB/HtrA family serine endopeptidase [Thermocoleostomius sinensis]|uniref:Trypsin-like peptidase domain-containing protein n=1 Tax=Thermocoleostomius sinensis A174 TaxID=2016057 RepID=A0A9E8ZDB8_9CYAN|nr:HhoA/HhoB/HtrA family serine endopeptidase [Thermocoleostomius sinensis]WAL61195.1 trypsin-like peptidase domain-containing protein [Thermocoleostomius sinensis A174]
MKTNPRSTYDSFSDGEFNRSESRRPASASRMKQTLTYLSLLLLGAGGVVVGDRLLNAQSAPPPQQSTLASPIAPQQTAVRTEVPNNRSSAAVPQNSNFIADAAQRVGPAVVRIDSQRTVLRRGPSVQDPFGRFFGDSLPPSSRVQEGTGSGFIIDANGIILTNAHVVDGADRVTVVLTDGRRFDGEVLGQDILTDVAVVKIEATDLPTVPIGDSEQLQPGEWAIAIGNPLGLDNTVTVGIVSATGRSSADIGVSDRRVGFIQTDAAINPGNSGGPLLNQQGEVIGMNTAIISGAQGLGFAVPINTVQRIADQLVANGRVDHPYLGVEMMPLTPELKEQINADPSTDFTVTDDEGVLIVRVAEGSPAASAGLRAGDILLRIGDQTVTDVGTVQATVERSQIGQDLPIEVRRNGETLRLSVAPGVLPTQAQR